MAKKEKKSKGEQLAGELLWSDKHIHMDDAEQIKAAYEFAEGYKKFLDAGKTERECVKYTEELLKSYGYRKFDPKKKYGKNDKVYLINRGKAIIATTFGSKKLSEGVRINAAHIDSPRLDLKPNPLYEKKEIAFFKTHYYGGIRKYQWATIPLALHGVVAKKNGEIVEITIGEKENEPVLCISDLLPHLSTEQNKRTLSDGIRGEELNLIVGSLPFEEDVKEPFKLKVLELLNKWYGITERDFASAEIQAVPATKARDVGLDASMIGAYGQDDRICAYTALMAELECRNPEHTTVTVLADKEEIGSDGNTGLQSSFVYDYLTYLAENGEADIREVCANSSCVSSDVNAAYDPTFSFVYEENNSCYLNHGCVITKYTGSRGKAGSSDASAEFVRKIIDILDEARVKWQIGELGAVDVGGGGTIAKFVAKMNIDVVDVGVPIISMHSPFELSGKLDLYHTYLAFKAFYK